MMNTYNKATQFFNSRPELVDVASVTIACYTEDELAETFDEMLDETYEDTELSGYTYSASTILKAVDPVAYRQELLTYIDSLDIVEIKDYYFDESQLLDFIEQHTTDEAI